MALPNPVAAVAAKLEILVDLEELERKELKNLSRQAIGCGVGSILGAITCWNPFITPWVTAFLTVPTCYVAHMRMKNVTELLQGETCLCHFCGPNPRNTLKACRPMGIACTVFAVISCITQIAFLAEYGKDNDMGGAVGAISIVCLLIMIALCFGLGFFAYNFNKAVMIFDAVTARQHLKQTELGGVAGAVQNAVGAVTGLFRGGQQQGAAAQPGAGAQPGAAAQQQPPPPGQGGAVNYGQPAAAPAPQQGGAPQQQGGAYQV